MANEAVIIELIESGVPVNYTSSGAINKGSIMYIDDPRLAVISAADNDPFCGIAAKENEAGDTTISCWTKGIFDILTSAAVTVGEKVSISGVNTVTKVVADTDNLFADVGVALETDGAGGEVIAVAVGIYQ